MTVTVNEHSWLDMSKSWFVKVNGAKSGGEIYSRAEAVHIAKTLAEQLKATYENDIEETNELFS